MTGTGAEFVASLLSGIAVAALATLIVRPTKRLAPRVRPYTVIARTSLGRSPDVLGIATSPTSGAGAVARVFGPILMAAAVRLGRLIETTGDDGMVLKLRQAGMFPAVPESERLQEYRMRQLGTTVVFSAVGVLVGALVGAGAGSAVLLGALGFVAGATRSRAALDRAVEDRRRRMRVEIYTVNQLLAMRIRAGGGVVQAVQQLTARGSGAVIDELEEALRLHRSGMPAAEAFERMASTTPDSHTARAYALLAAAHDRGADLGEALLALSEDVREGRREAMRRQATKRRAAMLVPTIAILAPVMLLFVAAPLPSIVFGNL